jgi:DNA-binding NarL/FixJ family response regulator
MNRRVRYEAFLKNVPASRPIQPQDSATEGQVKMEREVRIVVVDDHVHTRRGLKQVLESQPGWKVVGEAGDGDTAIQVVKDFEPDILTTDLEHPGLNGLEMAHWVAQNLPKVRVLIVTMTADKQLVRAILEAGARGYVMKSDAGRELVKAVETVLED